MTASTPTRRRVLTLGGAALLSGIAGCGAQSSPSDSTPTSDPTTTPGTGSPATSTENAYSRVYRDAIDSVVLVRTERGQGTGFMFDASHVVTNAHVVGQSSEAEIRFTDGQWRDGDVVGTDPHSDLAAIAVENAPESATPLEFIDGKPTIGQEVVAIGNPYDLGGTVTTGIISGTDRSIPAPTGYRIPDAIQTDAAVNPGNSGGPLMSLDGRVVAVINSGGGDNIGFGISAALTRRVVSELVETGSYEHSYLGISFVNVTPVVAEANELAEPRGVLVVNVVDGGPADGFLRPSDESRVVDGARVRVGGDVVVSVDGREIRTTEQVGSHLALETSPGDTVELTVLRDGEEQTVEFELGTRPT